ncbi:MAG: sigma-54-dependent Fis family transcriptional regulator [Bacteroidales bacterium]|nr:MAG: sigma-54-dependent Fis family transcriptional regulator [Bacteroidales bacterium]
MLAGRILIIDDNQQILESLQMLLKYEFKEIVCKQHPSEIVEKLVVNPFDVILLDMNFKNPNNTGKEGLFWLCEILKRDPLAVVILITAYGDISLAVQAIKDGATDFVTKPWDSDKLIITLKNALELRLNKLKVKKLQGSQAILRGDIDKHFQLFKGSSKSMEEVYRTIEKVASTDANVLIYGENGTGKELIARELHRKSNRADETFIGVDLGSISETLFESELFGHIKGAFTDAREDRAGRFEIATGGTLFMDEVSNLPFAQQSKLLTVLQNRIITRLGSNTQIPIDIRLITATNRNLEEMIRNSSFREDLFYRINTITIHLPPLRERKEDIQGLAEFFIKQYSLKYDKPNIELSTRALDALQKHKWPGNIRELKHTIEKSIILCDSDKIQPADLGLRYDVSLARASDNQSLSESEKQTIINALEKAKGNLSLAAKTLEISRTTLYAKIQKYNL